MIRQSLLDSLLKADQTNQLLDVISKKVANISMSDLKKAKFKAMLDSNYAEINKFECYILAKELAGNTPNLMGNLSGDIFAGNEDISGMELSGDDMSGSLGELDHLTNILRNQ